MSDDKLALYIHSKTAQQKLYKRTLIVILCSQIFGGAGLAAGITVGALLAKDMLGTDSVTGLPAALFTLGSAFAAYIVGRVSQKYGRRYGLASGFFVGSIGALGVIIAGATHNIALLFIALFLYGAGTATNLQARYAGTDLATDKQRATATSIALVATTFGAVAGPNLATTMGKVAEAFTLPTLVGPFILAAVAYALAGTVLFVFLRPDPLLVAKAIAMQNTTNGTVKLEATIDKQQLMRIGIIVGAIVLVLTQIIMTSIMTMTPVHMQGHGSHLNAVGIVIGLHVAAMYLPSLGTGILVDKVGRVFVALAASVTLAIAGICAAFAPGDSLFWLVVALMLLGLGWNFGLISGTAIIIDSTTIHNRAKVQGSVDVAVALGGSFGSVVSGVVVAFSSYATLGFIGMSFALLVIPIVLWGYKANKAL
ncbi:MFS transporter [Bacillus ndiopicus]|uniref:MFS transporter n=1 Tax=Bacillus ndiopicus TaxID=1347368 RepID=UPI0005AA3EF7|nr:MFS transporter [Bacillus ndiopicus]